jgi:hypothetical protein
MGNKAISRFVKFWHHQSVYVPFWALCGLLLESFGATVIASFLTLFSY